MVFFSSSSLVNITLPILVAIVSSPRQYHFAYPCNNYLLLYLIVFYLSWFFCVSLSKFPAQLSLSFHLLVIFLFFIFASSIPLHISLSQLSLRLIDITLPKFVTIVFYLSWSSSPCAYHLLILMITLILLVAIVDVLILISSYSHDLLLLISLPRRYHFYYPCRNPLLLFLVVFPLSWFICFSLSWSSARFS